MSQKEFSDDTRYKDLKCPECQSAMEIVFSARFRYRNGSRRLFYRCYRFPECSGIHGAHPNGAPLGQPADKETRALRQQVHDALNKRFPWATKSGRIKTNKWLKENGFGYGHVSKMNRTDCENALKILRDDVK